jgi:hypothetical protein
LVGGPENPRERRETIAIDSLLSIYLNDHLAGSTVGVELAKRAAGSNKGTPVGEALGSLAQDIEEDRRDLEAIMGALRIKKSPLKSSLAWVAEKGGRLKLNGRLVGYSDLSRLEEIEGLKLGVEGKLALWRSLERIAPSIEELPSNDLERLIKRAEDQRERLETLRMAAVDQAFT